VRTPPTHQGQPTGRPACLGALMRKERPLGQSIQQAMQLIRRQSCAGTFLLLLATGCLHFFAATKVLSQYQNPQHDEPRDDYAIHETQNGASTDAGVLEIVCACVLRGHEAATRFHGRSLMYGQRASRHVAILTNLALCLPSLLPHVGDGHNDLHCASRAR